MDKIYFDPAELAAMWKMSEKTLAKWRWLGIGPRYLRLGNQVRYSLSAIEEFEAEKTLKSTTEWYLKRNQKKPKELK